MVNLQPVAMLQRLPLPPDNRRGHCSVERLLVSPFRFCGRQWMWIRGDSHNQISKVALKVFTVPFLACATVLSSLPALIGALFFSLSNIPSVVEYQPRFDINLLRKDTSNEEIAIKIKDHLQTSGYDYSIKVRSRDRELTNDHYPEYIQRYITVINPSSSPAMRLWERFKNHFYNKEVSSLNSLSVCLFDQEPKRLAQLRDVLALHRSITFSLAFDLAYIRTEVGEGTL
ncbi:MAG: hypothetical protein BGO14_03140 [Chlamydiales bacterium 38-26]|nr:hypothetical protein [Chlamydiales bacterium]OJV09333.1 MAG: hypothetical protein BGO14_03140 [Chlamydiales bacterium 38-26]